MGLSLTVGLAGYQVVFVAEVVAKDGAILVRDRECKAYRVKEVCK